MSHSDPTHETAPDAQSADKAAAAPKPPSAAERALAEAAERRAALDRRPSVHPKEIGGPQGPEPTRYGDWDVNGLTSDF